MTMDKRLDGQVFVCNSYENVDFFIRRVKALRGLGVRHLVFHEGLHTNAENPIQTPAGLTYEYAQGSKVHAASLLAAEWGITVSCYVHPFRWGQAGATPEQIAEYVRGRGGGVFADGFQIHPSAVAQRKLAYLLRTAVDGLGPLIGHLSLEYHQWHTFPEWADVCHYCLIGEQPTFADWAAALAEPCHRVWFRTLIKWPETNPLNTNGDGYLRWVFGLNGALWLHQGGQIREWSKHLGFDRTMIP